MNRFDCRAADCEWTPGDNPADSIPADVTPPADRDQLRAHALATGHGLCCVCALSLTEHEPQTCQRCVTSTAETLTGIGVLYGEVAARVAGLRGVSLGGTRGGADGQPLPGGNGLVLVGRGSEGLAEDGQTTKDDDPVSVAYELSWWVAEWRERRNDPAPREGARPLRAEIRDALYYLADGLRWAGNSHPAYAEFATDMRDLHGALEQAASRHRNAEKAGAACFDCGGVLVRPVARDGLEVEHVVTCRQCQSSYTGARYLLALAHARRSALDGWVPYAAAATASRRPVATLKSWVQRLHVTAACSLADQRVYLWYPDVAERVAVLLAARQAAEARKNTREGAA